MDVYYRRPRAWRANLLFPRWFNAQDLKQQFDEIKVSQAMESVMIL